MLLALTPPWTVSTKKNILALASCLFYALWDYRYLGLLLFISLVDYACARRISKQAGRRRKAWLLVSIVSNLGMLAYFKYYDFFIDNLNGLLPELGQASHRNILLPAGISFYTLKTLSYVIDVYRSELAPVRSWRNYATFITFFPELIAGPIVRASVFLPQLDEPIGPTRARLARGASIFLVGFTKKLIADRIGSAIDPVFAEPQLFSALSAWIAIFGYSFQIFCDFAGYSDMAIGSAAMIGYRLPENFRAPYVSRSVTQFWRRWHMTLSFWLRDYLYIPLGGSRRRPTRIYVNLIVTMLLGGLWHGASWNFVVWGALHGAALAVERRFRQRAGAAALPAALSVALTFVFVTLCWIPFRCKDFPTTGRFIKAMFSAGTPVHWFDRNLLVAMAVAAGGQALWGLSDGNHFRAAAAAVRRALRWFGATFVEDPIMGRYVQLSAHSVAGAYLIFTWVTLAFLLNSASSSPFIYFQF